MALSALSVSSSGSPGPAPTSVQLPPGLNTGGGGGGWMGAWGGSWQGLCAGLIGELQDMFHLLPNGRRDRQCTGQDAARVGGGGGHVDLCGQAGHCAGGAGLLRLQHAVYAPHKTVVARRAARVGGDLTFQTA